MNETGSDEWLANENYEFFQYVPEVFHPGMSPGRPNFAHMAEPKGGVVTGVRTGRMSYADAWALQTRLSGELIRNKRAGYPVAPHHYFLLVEHPPVFTLGKSGDEAHLRLDRAGLAEAQIEYFKINRGGDITFHGPGQLVGYPILDLDQVFTDVHRYVRSIEEMIIRTLAGFGIEGRRDPEHTGVWVPLADGSGRTGKICAIGVHLSRWVTMHGFALNVNTDLGYFNHIVPCGIADPTRTVTSMSALLGGPADMEAVQASVLDVFSDVFGLEVIAGTMQDLISDETDVSR